MLTVRWPWDVKLGKCVKLYAFVNLYGCEIGDNTKVGTFVEIQKGVRVGANCKISSHTFICEGVTIEDGVFIGHGVTFINDLYPRATGTNGVMQTDADSGCTDAGLQRSVDRIGFHDPRRENNRKGFDCWSG